MYKSETDTQELKVTFLDDFKITYKDKELSQKSINSDKVTRLLAYLICLQGKKRIKKPAWNQPYKDINGKLLLE